MRVRLIAAALLSAALSAGLVRAQDAKKPGTQQQADDENVE